MRAIAGSWLVRAGGAFLLLSAAAALFAPDRRAAPAAPPATPRSAARTPVLESEPVQVAGVEPGVIKSLLNVPGRMRYGEFRWDETKVAAGPVWVRVDREAQLLSVFRGGHEIGTAVVLYGAPEKPTPAGRYPVLGKARHHRSATYGADMPFTLWLTSDGVAIHGSDVREGRATHGCVGLPAAFAKRLFEAMSIGDEVIIV